MKKYIFLLLLLLSGSIATAKDYWWQPLHLFGITDVAIKDSTIFVSTNSNGIFRSTNTGKSWEQLIDKLYYYDNITQIEICGPYVFFGTYNRGIHRSSDNGDSWIDVTQEIPISLINEIFEENSNSSRIFAKFYQGRLYLSTDFGETWNELSKEFANNYISCFTANESYIFVGINYGSNNINSCKLFRSADNGSSWNELNIDFPSKKIVSLTAKNSNIIMSVIDNDNGDSYKLFRSSNNGDDWIKVNIGDDTTKVIKLIVLENNIIALSSNKVYISTNDGLSWNLSESYPYSYSYVKSGNIIIAREIFSTDNGKTWKPLHSGLEYPYVNCLAKSGSSILAGTNRSGIFISEDNGYHWKKIHSEDSYDKIYSLATDGDKIFAGSESYILYSSNKGKNWAKILPDKESPIFTSLAVIGSNIYAGSEKSNTLFYSTDKGESWNKTKLNEHNIYCLYKKVINIYIGSYGKMLISEGYGNWKTSIIDSNYSVVISIAENDSNIFVGTKQNGIYKSTDNGLNWISINDGLPTTKEISSIAVIDSNIFITTCNGDGVFLSRDIGNTWTNVGSGLTKRYSISRLLIVGDYIYACSDIGGVYIAKLSDFGITSSTPNPSNSNDILIYPNPASNKITIDLSNNPEFSDIRIYNSLGMEVYKFENTQLLYKERIEISTAELAIGMYYLTLNDKGNRITKSFVVMR